MNTLKDWMKEDQIIDTLTQFLIHKGFTVNYEDIKKGNSPGIDILARKGNERWFIEVKGGTSGRKGSSRYGKEFTDSQVNSSMSTALFKTLQNTSNPKYEFKKGVDRIGMAFPEIDSYIRYHTTVAEHLTKLDIVTFWVQEDGNIRLTDKI